MLTISKQIEFDAGHRVPNHKSKCRNPHGHRYRVTVELVGEVSTDTGTSSEGMVMDFGDLKGLMTEHIHDVLDHGFILWENDVLMYAAFAAVSDSQDWNIIDFPYIPTAENLALWCWEELEPHIASKMGTFKLSSVCIHETPTSTATYKGPNA